MIFTKPLVISVDVGGTLGESRGRSLTSDLMNLTSLPAAEARRLIREVIHTAPCISGDVIAEICRLLDIQPQVVPPMSDTAVFSLYRESPGALSRLSAIAPVVTLSNVAVCDSATGDLEKQIGSWVSGFFPSFRTGYAKPSSGAFHAVRDEFSVEASDIFHIGDSWECDVEGALAAGCRPLWIDRSSTSNALGVPQVQDIAGAATYIEAAIRGDK